MKIYHKPAVPKFKCRQHKPRKFRALQKFFIFLLLSGFVFSATAQIALTQTDFPGVGNSTTLIYDTLPDVSIVPGAAGTAQTWDFSLLHNHGTVVNSYVDPATTPFASSFTMTNVADLLSGPYYYYYGSSPSEFLLWGMGGDLLGIGTQVSVVYGNPETYMEFPSTYNSSFTDTSRYDQKFFYGQTISGYYCDSARQLERNHITSTFDAWGDLTTPNGTFPVIRQNMVKQTWDSTWVRVQTFNMWISAGNTAETTQYYVYYTNGLGDPVVSIGYGSDTLIVWNNAASVGIDVYSQNTLRVYPNPARDWLELGAIAEKAEIIDNTGRIVLSEKNVSTINISDLKNGIYIMKVFNNGRLMFNKIIIEN